METLCHYQAYRKTLSGVQSSLPGVPQAYHVYIRNQTVM